MTARNRGPPSATARTILMIGGNSGIGLATARVLQALGNTLIAAARSAGPLEELGIPVKPFDAFNLGVLPPVLDGFVYFPGSITLKPFHASIAAAKGAVEGLVLSLAAELAPKIRINAIAPALTDAPLAGDLLNTESKKEASAKRHPPPSRSVIPRTWRNWWPFFYPTRRGFSPAKSSGPMEDFRRSARFEIQTIPPSPSSPASNRIERLARNKTFGASCLSTTARIAGSTSGLDTVGLHGYPGLSSCEPRWNPTPHPPA